MKELMVQGTHPEKKYGDEKNESTPITPKRDVPL
jgi:hypothetical protein